MAGAVSKQTPFQRSLAQLGYHPEKNGRYRITPERVTEMREARGHSLGELAELVGMPKGKVVRLEDGRILPREGDLIKLCVTLSVPPARFFMPPPPDDKNRVIFFNDHGQPGDMDWLEIQAQDWLESIKRIAKPRAGQSKAWREVYEMARKGLCIVVEEYTYDELVRETANSWLLSMDTDKLWFPKNRCRIDETDHAIQVPLWLAEEKGLE